MNTHYCHLSARVDAWSCRVYLGLSNDILCCGGESILVMIYLVVGAVHGEVACRGVRELGRIARLAARLPA
jgi:hypothetical protein